MCIRFHITTKTLKAALKTLHTVHENIFSSFSQRFEIEGDNISLLLSTELIMWMVHRKENCSFETYTLNLNVSLLETFVVASAYTKYSFFSVLVNLSLSFCISFIFLFNFSWQTVSVIIFFHSTTTSLKSCVSLNLFRCCINGIWLKSLLVLGLVWFSKITKRPLG